ADEHLALRYTRGHGDGVVIAHLAEPQALRNGIHRPHFLAGLRVDGDEARIERAHDDLAIPGRDAAVHEADVVTQAHARDHRVVFPELLAGLAVEGVHHVACRRDIDDAVDVQRRAVLVLVSLV